MAPVLAPRPGRPSPPPQQQQQQQPTAAEPPPAVTTPLSPSTATGATFGVDGVSPGSFAEGVHAEHTFPGDGVRVEVLQGFAEFARQLGGEQWTTRQVCENLVLPLTAKVKLSWAEVLCTEFSYSHHPCGLGRREHVAPATHFISHAWDAPFATVVSTVKAIADGWREAGHHRRHKGNRCSLRSLRHRLARTRCPGGTFSRSPSGSPGHSPPGRSLSLNRIPSQGQRSDCSRQSRDGQAPFFWFDLLCYNQHLGHPWLGVRRNSIWETPLASLISSVPHGTVMILTHGGGADPPGVQRETRPLHFRRSMLMQFSDRLQTLSGVGSDDVPGSGASAAPPDAGHTDPALVAIRQTLDVSAAARRAGAREVDSDDDQGGEAAGCCAWQCSPIARPFCVLEALLTPPGRLRFASPPAKESWLRQLPRLLREVATVGDARGMRRPPEKLKQALKSATDLPQWAAARGDYTAAARLVLRAAFVRCAAPIVLENLQQALAACGALGSDSGSSFSSCPSEAATALEGPPLDVTDSDPGRSGELWCTAAQVLARAAVAASFGGGVAVNLMRSAYSYVNHALGPESRQAAALAEELAPLLRDSGDVPGAAAALRALVAWRQHALGQSDPQTLGAVLQLAELLHNSDAATAGTLLDRVISDHPGGDVHRDVIAALSIKVRLLRREGAVPEAQNALRRLASARAAALGDDHPCTVSTVSQLGEVLHQSGAHDEAERLLWRAVAVRTARDPPGETPSPATYAAAYRLSSLLDGVGDEGAASGLFCRPRPGCSDLAEGGSGAPVHPEHLSPPRDMAEVAESRGCADVAALLRDVADRRER